MARSAINLPLVLTVVFVLLVALLMTGVLPSPVTIAQTDCSPEYIPPNVGYDDCKRTQTAEAAASPTNTTTGGGGGGGSTPESTATRTPTATRTLTATAAIATPTLAPATATPTATRPLSQSQPAPVTPTGAPTAALPAGTATLFCVPGTSVALVGQTEPGVQLLAFFDDRPVGGGFSQFDGRFSIDLLIGSERPGFYVVEVRNRVSQVVIAQFGCEVPAFTPTPTLQIGL